MTGNRRSKSINPSGFSVPAPETAGDVYGAVTATDDFVGWGYPPGMEAGWWPTSAGLSSSFGGGAGGGVRLSRSLRIGGRSFRSVLSGTFERVVGLRPLLRSYGDLDRARSFEIGDLRNGGEILRPRNFPIDEGRRPIGLLERRSYLYLCESREYS